MSSEIRLWFEASDDGEKIMLESRHIGQSLPFGEMLIFDDFDELVEWLRSEWI